MTEKFDISREPPAQSP